MTENSGHVAVLLKESIGALDIKENGAYLDATFGRGGHSKLLLSRLGEQGNLYAIDRDPQAAAVANAITDQRFHFSQCAFSDIDAAFETVNKNSLDGILFDLGVSSPQLDEGERGFSFQKEGPLDMRMDTNSGITAKEWIMSVDEGTLGKTIRDLGGESYSIAKRLAKAIYTSRERINTTLDLASVVKDAMPKKMYKPNHHPATQTFQAIRMAVNNEVGEIREGLIKATQLLKPGGILAVITFHGLEDALVKRFIRSQEGEDVPAEIPVEMAKRGQVLKLLRPVIKPSAGDVANNPRCRSARLRRAVKV